MADRTKVSFREAEGRPRFPPILQWGEIDQRLRAGLWMVFGPFLDANIRYSSQTGFYAANKILETILRKNHFDRLHGYHDEFASKFESYTARQEFIQKWSEFFREENYIELFDFITCVVRIPACPSTLTEAFARILDASYSPYRLLLNPPTVVPVVSSEHAATMQSDLAKVFQSPFEGAKTHLQAALDAMGVSESRTVVRESIQAVESAVRDFMNDPDAILSKALRRLSKDRQVHPALSDAFEKLYAYTSDEKGIRHALVFGENENVGFDEALFFLSACSAFVAFLSLKSKASVARMSEAKSGG